MILRPTKDVGSSLAGQEKVDRLGLTSHLVAVRDLRWLCFSCGLELARGMANAQSEGNVPGSKPLTTLSKLKTNNKYPLDSANYRSWHTSLPMMSVLGSPPRKASRFKRTFLRQSKGSLMKGTVGTQTSHRLSELVESASLVKTIESIQRAKELSNNLHLEYTRLCELNRLFKKQKEEFKQAKTVKAEKQAKKDDSLSRKEVKWERYTKLIREQPSPETSQKIPNAFTFVDSPRFLRRATDRDVVKVLERKIRGSLPVDRQNIVCGRLRQKFSLAYEPLMAMAMTRAQWQESSGSLSGDFSDIWTNKKEEEFLLYKRMSYKAYKENAREVRSKWRKTIRIVKNIVHFERCASYISYHLETNLQMYTHLGGRALAAMLGSECPTSFSTKEIKSSKPTLNKELTISSKVQEIMLTPPDSRTEEQLSLVLCDLQCVPTFCTFPLTVQEQIARYCFFISLGKNRVIIRRGQIPQNWYFIVSGQAMIFETCDDTTFQSPTILNRGMTIGELGIKDNSCHKCTVTSRNNMHMIALDRAIYSSLFYDSGETPEHIRFILEQEFMKYWPGKMLLEHPSECFNLFYPKNIVLVVDSTNSDWIYVIRSGSCIVYMYVPETRASWHDSLVSLPNTNINIESWPESKTDTGRFKIKRRKDQFVLYNRLSATNIRARDMEEISSLSLRVPGQKWTLNQANAKLDKMQDSVSFDGVNRNQSSDFDSIPPIDGYKKKSPTFTLKSQMTERNANENQKEDETDCKMKVNASHETVLPQSVENKEPIKKHIRKIKKLTQDDIMKSTKTVLERQKQYKVPQYCKPRKPPPPQKSSPYSIVSPPVFVEIKTLTSGDTFGLDQLREPGYDDKREKSAKVSLVSQGAEVIMINKRFFMANVNEKTMTLIHTLVQVYPSQEDVQTRYRLQLAWKLNAMKIKDELYQEFQYSGKKYYGPYFQEPPIPDPIKQLAE